MFDVSNDESIINKRMKWKKIKEKFSLKFYDYTKSNLLFCYLTDFHSTILGVPQLDAKWPYGAAF